MANHPHNNFFEKVFSMLDVTRDFLEQIPPKEFREPLDLSELKLLDKTHISDNLRKTHSDLLFEAHLKAKVPIRIAILMEHKSNPPVYPHTQILHYISSIHQTNLLNKEPLIAVLPILFYHGNKKWKKKPFTESFPELPKFFHQFIPTFGYLLIDLDDYPDDFILNLKTGFLKNALLILKHSGEKEYLIENVRKIFVDIEKLPGAESRMKLYETLINYLILGSNLKEKDMKQISTKLPRETTPVFYSTADRLRYEGKIEGKIEGYEINNLIKNITFSLNLITQFPDWSLEKVANLTSTKIEFIKKIKTGFDGGKEKKARKVVFGFFKKFEDLEEPIIKELEGILEKFVPLFKSKK